MKRHAFCPSSTYDGPELRSYFIRLSTFLQKVTIHTPYRGISCRRPRRGFNSLRHPTFGSGMRSSSPSSSHHHRHLPTLKHHELNRNLEPTLYFCQHRHVTTQPQPQSQDTANARNPSLEFCFQPRATISKASFFMHFVRRRGGTVVRVLGGFDQRVRM